MVVDITGTIRAVVTVTEGAIATTTPTIIASRMIPPLGVCLLVLCLVIWTFHHYLLVAPLLSLLILLLQALTSLRGYYDPIPTLFVKSVTLQAILLMPVLIDTSLASNQCFLPMLHSSPSMLGNKFAILTLLRPPT